MAIAIFLLVLGAVKLADVGAHARSIYRASRSPKADIDWEWTPIFAWARRHRKHLEAKQREKGVRALALTLSVDVVFRAPVMAIITGGVVLYRVGTIRGTQQGAGGACILPTTISGADGWLNVATGSMAVLVGMASVFTLLQVIAAGRTNNPWGAAGHYVGRSRGEARRKLLDPVTAALGTIMSLIIAFAALYGALVATHGSWIAAKPCHLGPLDLIYFSSSVGATVGFGDISPTAPALRAVTTAQILAFFAMLALFLHALWVGPRQAAD